MEGKGLTAILGIIALVGVAAVYHHEGIVDLRVGGTAEAPAHEQLFEPGEAPPPGDASPRRDETREPPGPDPAGGYAVSASHPLAVQVGMEVLAAGGNAADAAIAVSYALGVVEPFGSGVGGGGVMLVHPLGEEPVAYNYRETAPRDGEPGFLGIGVPGFVLGMEEIHAQHATFPLPDLIAPAIRFAENGVPVSDFLTERLDRAQFRMPVQQLPHLYPDGVPVAPGTTLKQPELAETLRTIADNGSDAFYTGAIADRIAEQVDGLALGDLADYDIDRTEPVMGPVGDLRVWTAPPPMTGVTLVQILQMAEAARLPDRHEDEAIVVLAAILRAAEEDRFDLVGDPRLVDVPVDRLTDPDAAGQRLEGLGVDPPEGREGSDAEADQARVDTTHFVVVDSDGTMVSATNTLSNFFGSGQFIDGFFMNDQLTNFSEDPASPNLPEPGKRPRSFVTPTIVADGDQRPVLGIGSPGGNRIPALLGQVLIRWLLGGATLEEAVDAPRFVVDDHAIIAEDTVPPGGLAAARDAGYGVEQRPATQFFGGIQALLVDYDAGRLRGVADERRDGTWDSAEP